MDCFTFTCVTQRLIWFAVISDLGVMLGFIYETAGISRGFDSQQQMIVDLFDLLTSFYSAGFCLFTVWSPALVFILSSISSPQETHCGKTFALHSDSNTSRARAFVFRVSYTQMSKVWLTNLDVDLAKPCLTVLTLKHFLLKVSKTLLTWCNTSLSIFNMLLTWYFTHC